MRGFFFDYELAGAALEPRSTLKCLFVSLRSCGASSVPLLYLHHHLQWQSDPLTVALCATQTSLVLLAFNRNAAHGLPDAWLYAQGGGAGLGMCQALRRRVGRSAG